MPQAVTAAMPEPTMKQATLLLVPTVYAPPTEAFPGVRAYRDSIDNSALSVNPELAMIAEVSIAAFGCDLSHFWEQH